MLVCKMLLIVCTPATGWLEEPDEEVEKALPSAASRSKEPDDEVTARVGRRRRRSTRAAARSAGTKGMEPLDKAGRTPLGRKLAELRDAQDLTIKEMADWGDRSASTMRAIIDGTIVDPADEVLTGLAKNLKGVTAKGLMKLRDDHLRAMGEEHDTLDKKGVKKAEPVDAVGDDDERSAVDLFYGALDQADQDRATVVGKGSTFKARMLKNQLWTITSALSEALRDVLGDKAVKNKVKAVREVLDEFVDWLEDQVGDAVQKEDVVAASLLPSQGNQGMTADDAPLDAIQDVQDETLKAIEKQSRVLAAIGKRLMVLEKQHPGRRSELGGQDIDEDVVKANGQAGKGFRGLNINLG